MIPLRHCFSSPRSCFHFPCNVSAFLGLSPRATHSAGPRLLSLRRTAPGLLETLRRSRHENRARAIPAPCPRLGVPPSSQLLPGERATEACWALTADPSLSWSRLIGLPTPLRAALIAKEGALPARTTQQPDDLAQHLQESLYSAPVQAVFSCWAPLPRCGQRGWHRVCSVISL